MAVTAGAPGQILWKIGGNTEKLNRSPVHFSRYHFSGLMLLVERQEGHQTVQKSCLSNIPKVLLWRYLWNRV